MRVETELDIFLLVGEMPEVACEHSEHEHRHGGGPATHYLKSECFGCHKTPRVFAVCAYIVGEYHRNANLECAECGVQCMAQEVWTLLGKI